MWHVNIPFNTKCWCFVRQNCVVLLNLFLLWVCWLVHLPEELSIDHFAHPACQWVSIYYIFWCRHFTWQIWSCVLHKIWLQLILSNYVILRAIYMFFWTLLILWRESICNFFLSKIIHHLVSLWRFLVCLLPQLHVNWWVPGGFWFSLCLNFIIAC